MGKGGEERVYNIGYKTGLQLGPKLTDFPFMCLIVILAIVKLFITHPDILQLKKRELEPLEKTLFFKS